MTAEETVQVSLRIPRHQREEWQAHAGELDMAQSEFVVSMVQAGRRGFEAEAGDGASGSRSEPGSPPATPGVEGLESRVQAVIRDRGVASWDEIVEELVEDFETELDRAVKELDNADVIQHAPRDGGYVLTDDVE